MKSKPLILSFLPSFSIIFLFPDFDSRLYYIKIEREKQTAEREKTFPFFFVTFSQIE
jgi:hypothetical protein